MLTIESVKTTLSRTSTGTDEKWEDIAVDIVVDLLCRAYVTVGVAANKTVPCLEVKTCIPGPGCVR